MSKSNLKKMINEMAERIVDSIGNTDYGNILALLEAKTKREAKRIGNALTVNQAQFSSLILNAHSHGYDYRRCFKTHMAADLSEERLEQYVEKKDIAKIVQKTFIERKQNCFHLFEKEAEWHLFYFDFGDIKDNHWKEGPHIHYISHLWGIDRDKVFKQIGKRNYTIGGMHIRTVFE